MDRIWQSSQSRPLDVGDRVRLDRQRLQAAYARLLAAMADVLVECDAAYPVDCIESAEHRIREAMGRDAYYLLAGIRDGMARNPPDEDDFDHESLSLLARYRSGYTVGAAIAGDTMRPYTDRTERED